MTPPDLTITQFSPTRHPSPLFEHQRRLGCHFSFVSDQKRLRMNIFTADEQPELEPIASFEQAGPREHIYFDPLRTRAAIVTCGGLCPGLNDVIRAIVFELYYWYGVRQVLGIRYGYAGFRPDTHHPPILLSVDDVENIHARGGTILGSSRGKQDTNMIVDTLIRSGVQILFCVGGDGTLRGAHEIAEEIKRRGLFIAVVGVPKTIDNDIDMIYRTFGFKTAVAEAARVLECAHVEAKDAPGGVGLVKLMGRDSGFIAAHSTLASGNVNYCLIPEIKTPLMGEYGFLEHLRSRLQQRGHAVIAVAEGFGQDLMATTGQCDASGNTKLQDIGPFLKQEIIKAFAEWNEPVNVRYFDPSYQIRSIPANSDDSIFCADLGRHAVHAAMAGKTDLLIGLWHGVFTHVPLAAAIGRRKKVEPDGSLWRGVLSTTGQPSWMPFSPS